MIRTTISVQETVLKGAKQLARNENKTLGDTITELLQLGLLEKEKKSPATKPRKWPDFSMGKPYVSLEDKERLYQIMDGNRD